jgi:CRP-like cAMP-binding protein
MSKVGTSSASLGVAPAALGRIKLFAGLKEDQIEQFLGYVEVVEVPQYSDLVHKGQYGDAMYVVLEGELRALTIVEGRESTLATIAAGECFGEISLLDQGPRSAEVVANRDTRLLKLSSAAFERLIRESPALALPFVLALSRALVDRLRHTTKRYEDTIRFIRTSSAAH